MLSLFKYISATTASIDAPAKLPTAPPIIAFPAILTGLLPLFAPAMAPPTPPMISPFAL
ncbi:hypothetical protein [Campylobacter sp. VTCC 70190]|uniref:hypothetical protein n=1 Tax=Campylobacter sp. VTCC 70190 TaxID=3392118 RepID=UPI00398E3738